MGAVFFISARALQERILERFFLRWDGFLLRENVVSVGEEALSHGEDAVRDEESSEDIDRVMEMTQDDTSSQKDGPAEAQVAHPLFFPVNESEEVGHPSMTGEEIVPAVRQGAKNIVGVEVRTIRKWG